MSGIGQLFKLVIVALMSEAVWDTLKHIYQQGRISWDRVGALAIAILLAYSTNLNLLSIVGINMKYPMVGIVLTGVLISRGVSFIQVIAEKIVRKML